MSRLKKISSNINRTTMNDLNDNFSLLGGGYASDTVGNTTITRDSQGKAATITDSISATALTRNTLGQVTTVTTVYTDQTIRETINRDVDGTVTSITREVL